MFGFLIGTACLVGLVHTLHGGSCHGWGWRSGGWRMGNRRRGWLRLVFERLDTSPGQEKAIVKIVDDLMDTLRQAKRDARSVRDELGGAMRRDAFDATAVDQGHEAVHGTVKQAVLAALGQIHEVLDERQRKILADLIESGPHVTHPWACHPYRHAH